MTRKDFPASAATPRRGSLLYKFQNTIATALAFTAVVVWADDPEPYITGADYEVSNEWLIVKSGIGTFVNKFTAPSGSEATRIQVNEGATLKLGINGPCSPSAILCIFGTFDLNGHSLTAYCIDNSIPFVKAEGGTSGTLIDTNSLRRTSARIINTSSTAVTLTLSSSQPTFFYGSIEELPGGISVDAKNAPFSLFSPEVENPISSIKADGGGVLQPETMPYRFKFVFQPPSDPTKPIRIGEIDMTYQGRSVPVSGAYATSQAASGLYFNLRDGAALTEWVADEMGVQTVTITLPKPSQVDGYRITSGSKAEGQPTGWDVYAYRDSFGSVLVESRRDVQWYARRQKHTMTNFTFNADVKLGRAFGTNTAVALTSTASHAFRLSGNGPLPVGTMTGSGATRLEQESVLEPGDISGYTGAFLANSDVWWKMAHLRLSASRGGAEQPVSITSAQNLAVENGGTAPVSVLVDDSRAGEHLFGKLADGEHGKLGLVKRGGGERVIETEDASYTGPTVVHEGTLTVAKRRSFTARYIRITPTDTYGVKNSTAPWGMNEFCVLDAEGNLVAWPSGTVVTSPGTALNSSNALSKLIDGDTASRMLLSPYSDGYAPVTIDTKTGVTFASYKWWSPHNNKVDANRTPTAWTIEISDDNLSWIVCDNGLWGWTADDETASASWTGDNSVARGPFSAAQSAGTALYTLDRACFGTPAGPAARATHGKLKSRYFMFQVKETANPNRGNDVNSYGWELAEICLMKDGERIDWPEGVTIAIYGANVNANSNSRLANLVNNVIWEPNGGTVGEGMAPERTFITEVPSYVVIDAGEEMEFDSYAFYSTSMGGTFMARLPKAWNFGITTEAVLPSTTDVFASFSVIDWVGDYTPGRDYAITQAYQRIGPFELASRFPILDTDASNAIGDESPVMIGEGATLKLATNYEKFGPLSGEGALYLAHAVGEINACADATFSGRVDGKGTLAVCGTATQTFDGATLSGVETLELNGGTVAGTASFGGNDVTVAFNGGATVAALSGIGTLTVTGAVKYAVPDVSGTDSCSRMLFTASSIPAASKALLEAGEIVNASRKWKWSVGVSDTSVVLRGNKIGLMVLIK